MNQGRAFDIVLRPATAADADSLTVLFLAARRGSMPYLPELHSDAETYAWMAGHVLRESQVTAALAEGEIVGFSAVASDFLEHLYVAPAHHGRGIGSALLAAVKRTCPAGLRLFVFQQNQAARRFYEKRGFTLVRLGDGSGNEERLPDALYALP